MCGLCRDLIRFDRSVSHSAVGVRTDLILTQTDALVFMTRKWRLGWDFYALSDVFSDVFVPYVTSSRASLQLSTCRPAMGYSFAAGATDGPGVRPFTQGTNTSLNTSLST